MDQNADNNSDSKKKISLSKEKSKRVYLRVSFEQKDDAKRMGAKWDFRKKKWYINEDSKNKEILLIRYPL